MGQDSFVNRFQEARSQGGVDAVGRVYDLLGYFVFASRLVEG